MSAIYVPMSEPRSLEDLSGEDENGDEVLDITIMPAMQDNPWDDETDPGHGVVGCMVHGFSADGFRISSLVQLDNPNLMVVSPTGDTVSRDVEQPFLGDIDAAAMWDAWGDR